MNKNLFLITVLGCLIIACTPQNNPGGDEGKGKEATAIKLSKNELTLEKGANETLTVSFTPSNVANKALTWVSSNKNIAEVTDGIVVGVNAGSTEIIVKSGDLTDKCTVTVVVSAISISVEPTEIELSPGGTASLTATVIPNDTTDEVEWSSSDENVASVKDGVVSAMAEGVATINVKAGSQVASCDITVIKMRAIDLGLSVKWANRNLGADTPEDYGDYYAWGETVPKDNYRWSTYELCNGSYTKLTKYNNSNSYGVVDNKTEFMDYDYEDDAARQALGGKWRVPTDADWTELREQCTWTWVTNYNSSGINGRLVKATNGNSIFLPAADVRYGTDLSNEGSYGHYWSSTRRTDIPYQAWSYDFDSNNLYVTGFDRYLGLSVRPVSE